MAEPLVDRDADRFERQEDEQHARQQDPPRAAPHEPQAGRDAQWQGEAEVEYLHGVRWERGAVQRARDVAARQRRYHVR